MIPKLSPGVICNHSKPGRVSTESIAIPGDPCTRNRRPQRSLAQRSPCLRQSPRRRRPPAVPALLPRGHVRGRAPERGELALEMGAERGRLEPRGPEAPEHVVYLCDLLAAGAAAAGGEVGCVLAERAVGVHESGGKVPETHAWVSGSVRLAHAPSPMRPQAIPIVPTVKCAIPAVSSVGKNYLTLDVNRTRVNVEGTFLAPVVLTVERSREPLLARCRTSEGAG